MMNSIQVPIVINDGTTEWVTIIDRKKMEKLLVENNRNIFLKLKEHAQQ